MQLIYVEQKVWNSQKVKSVKSVIIKKLATKIFQAWYTMALFWNLALVLALHCYCGDNVR